MEQLLLKMLENAPIGGGVVIVVYMFLNYLKEQGRLNRELLAEQGELNRKAIESISQAYQQMGERFYDVIDRNTTALTRISDTVDLNTEVVKRCRGQ